MLSSTIKCSLIQFFDYKEHTSEDIIKVVWCDNFIEMDNINMRIHIKYYLE